MGRSKRTVVSIGLTSLIVLLLILSGPAAAVKVTLLGIKTTAQPMNPSNDIIEFNLTVQLKSPDQYVPMQYIMLNLTGPLNRTFLLDLNGNVISGNLSPNELVVTPVGSLGNLSYGFGYGYDENAGTYHNFGYGYGYGSPGNLPLQITYNIKLNTTYMFDGNYTAIAYVMTGNSNKPYFASTPVSFQVLPRQITVSLPPLPPNSTNSSGIITTPVGSYEWIVYTNGTTPPVILTVNISVNPPSGAMSLSGVPGAIPDIYFSIDVSDPSWYNNVTIHFRMYYNESKIPSGVSESSLRPLRYTNGSWVRLVAPPQQTLADGTVVYASGVNTSANYVWANLSHFSVYGIGGVVTAAAPAPVGGITPGVSTVPPDTFKITIGFIKPGETKAYNITGDGEIYFTQVAITAAKWITGVTVEGRTVTKPAELPAAPGEVLAYIEVSTAIKEEQVSYADITFRVPKEWLEEKGIAQENVALYRYTNTWTKLPTSKVGEDSSFVYYKARTPGFSYFAIVGEVAPPTTPPPTAPPTTPPPTAPPTTPPPTTPAPVTPAPTTPAPTTPAPTVPPPPKPWKWVVLLLIIIAVAAAAYYYTRKR